MVVAVTAIEPLPEATEVVEPTVTAEISDPSDGVGSGEIVLTAADSDALEAALEEILGSDVTVDEAVVIPVSTETGITIEIPVEGLTETTGAIGDLDVQIGQLSLKIADGVGTAALQISEDIAVVGEASVSLDSSGLDVQISNPVLQYPPETVDDGSFGGTGGGSGVLIESVGVSFAVGLDNLPDSVTLTTTYSASTAELAASTGTVFALSGDEELAYFVSVEKYGITQDDLGDNAVAMNVPLSWLDEMVASGREIAITKISDSGDVFTESAQCERLSDIAVCTVTFIGEAGGFSVFAIYGFVNENPQPAPQPLATELPTQAPAAPMATAAPSVPTGTPVPPTVVASAVPTPEIAPAPTASSSDSDLAVVAGSLGDTGGGGPSLIVIVAIAVVAVVAGGTVVSAYYRRPSISTAGLIVIATAAGTVVLLAGNASVAQAGGFALPTVDESGDIAQFDIGDMPDFNKFDFRYTKVGSGIRALSEAYSEGVLDEWLTDDQYDVIDPRIDVTIWYESVEDVDLEFKGFDAIVLNRVENIVEASVPVRLARVFSYLPGVIRVDRITPPQVEAVTSEGAAVHGSPAWNSLGLDGSGIKVGVIDVGFQGWSSISPSELPTPTAVRCYTAIGVFTSTLSDCEVDSSHGTAVSEAVDDVAPAVEFYISNPASTADLLAATQWMVAQGGDVINHSVAWTWDGPGDGTSPSSDSPLVAVDTAVSGGVLWVNAAGNDYGEVWYGNWNDSDSDGFLNFSGIDEGNAITVSSPSTVSAQLRWDGSWSGTSSDLALCLVNSSSVFVACADSLQSGQSGQVPYEFLNFAVSAGTYSLAIFSKSGALPSWVQLHSWSQQTLQHIGDGRSIANPAESANSGMLAVGAARHSTTSTIESFSSRGPTIDGRNKPDIVGADGANSATSGSWFGTSQASPHVAGLAALVLQRFSSKTPAELATYLKNSATDEGTSGIDNTWGNGFAKIYAPAAPVAVTDSYSEDEDAVLVVAAPGVKANDSDDADFYSPVLVATPTDGSLNFFPNGEFNYTPNANFNGSDSFTYKDVDPWQTSSTVSVSLTINAVADVSGASTAQGVSNPNTVGISVTGTGNSTGVAVITADSGGAFSKQLSADTFTFGASVDGFVDRSLSG